MKALWPLLPTKEPEKEPAPLVAVIRLGQVAVNTRLALELITVVATPALSSFNRTSDVGCSAVPWSEFATPKA